MIFIIKQSYFDTLFYNQVMQVRCILIKLQVFSNDSMKQIGLIDKLAYSTDQSNLVSCRGDSRVLLAYSFLILFGQVDNIYKVE